jgi:hypothetical protein
MDHETTWYTSTVGAAAAAGCDFVAARSWPDRHCAQSRCHSAKHLPMASESSPTRDRGPACAAGTGSATQADDSAEAAFGRSSAERSRGSGIWDGFVDVPTNRPGRAAAIRGTLPRRCGTALDGRLGFFPLKSPNAALWSVTKLPSHTGWRTIGRGSNDERLAHMRTLSLLTKQAFCSSPWCSEPGACAGRRQSFATKCGTIAESPRSEGSRSRLAEGIWGCTCNSTRTGPSGRSRLLTSCGICSGICEAKSSWSGTISSPIAAGRWEDGFAAAGDSIWNTSPAMPLSLIPSSTHGRTSRGRAWRTSARRMWTVFTAACWWWPVPRPSISRCSAASFVRANCLFD